MGDDMIDWSRVRDLKEEVGEEDFPEVVDLFMEEVQEVIDGLSEIDDAGEMAQALHFLRGSALSLGFSAFSELCAAGERACAHGPAGQIDISALVERYEASKAAFLSEMDTRIAA